MVLVEYVLISSCGPQEKEVQVCKCTDANELAVCHSCTVFFLFSYSNIGITAILVTHCISRFKITYILDYFTHCISRTHREGGSSLQTYVNLILFSYQPLTFLCHSYSLLLRSNPLVINLFFGGPTVDLVKY